MTTLPSKLNYSTGLLRITSTIALRWMEQDVENVLKDTAKSMAFACLDAESSAKTSKFE